MGPPENLRWLGAGAYIVNNARGAICDTDAIVRALGSGQLGGAHPRLRSLVA